MVVATVNGRFISNIKNEYCRTHKTYLCRRWTWRSFNLSEFPTGSWPLCNECWLWSYGRFFRLYLYTAIAPVPLSTFAGELSQNVGKSFIKSYAAVCLEGAIIVLGCIIFSLFAASPPAAGWRKKTQWLPAAMTVQDRLFLRLRELTASEMLT